MSANTETATTEPRVNSIIDLLAADDPTGLEALRNRHPEHKELLRSGLEMGTRHQIRPGDHIYCELCRDGVSAAERQLKGLFQSLPARLRRAKKLRLIASIVTSLASAGVLTSAFANAWIQAQVAAIVTFVAALGTLMAQYFETPLGGGRATIANSLDELIGLEGRLREVKAKLQEAQLATEQQVQGRCVTTCRDVAPSVNEIAAHIRRIQLFAGTN